MRKSLTITEGNERLLKLAAKTYGVSESVIVNFCMANIMLAKKFANYEKTYDSLQKYKNYFDSSLPRGRKASEVNKCQLQEL